MADKRLEIVLAAKDATKGAFNSVNAHMGRLKKQVFSLQGVMVGLASAGAMGLVVKKSLDLADATAKTADRIGITTDALQRFRYIAERTGTDAGQLDKGLQTFVKRFGELKNQTGALNTYLNKLDEEFKKQVQSSGSSAEALDLIYKRMAAMTDQSDRAALAAAAFSKTAGVSMSLMAPQVDDLSKRFKSLGLAVDEKLLRKSEAANDAITDLTSTLQGNFQSIILKLAPNIAQISNSMTDWVAANQVLVKQEVPQYLDKLFTRSTKLAGALWKVSEYTRMITFGLDDVMKIADYFDEPSVPTPTTEDTVSMSLTKTAPHPLNNAELLDYNEVFNDMFPDHQTSEWMDDTPGIMADIADDMYMAMSTNFFNPMTEGFLDMGDMAKSVLLSIQQSLVDSLSQDIVQGLFGSKDKKGDSTQGLFGMVGGWISSFFHEGGVVGQTTVPTQIMSPAVFAGASRLHNGLKPDEFPAILQQGETVIPKGGRGGGGVPPKDGGGNVINHYHINAVDAQSFTELCRRNPSAITGPWQEQYKRGAMRNLIRSTM